jgi:hypothetical protein
MPTWNDSTPTEGHIVSRLRDNVCDACGRLIPAGVRHLWFPWFPGRRGSVACVLCGTEAPEQRVTEETAA